MEITDPVNYTEYTPGINVLPHFRPAPPAQGRERSRAYAPDVV